MTLSALRFHTLGPPTVSAVQERRLLAAILEGSDGKLGGGTGFQVNPNTGKNVRIEPCVSAIEQLIINGTESPMQGAYAVQLDAVDTSITLDPEPGSNSRIDLVICYVQDDEYSTQSGHSSGDYTPAFAKVNGAVSGSPVAPDPAAAGFENYHVLAEVLRQSSEASTIPSAAFTNRVYKLLYGATVALGEVQGDGSTDQLYVEWPNHPRLHKIEITGRMDAVGPFSGFVSCDLRLNGSAANDMSVRRTEVEGTNPYDDWSGSDGADGIFFGVGDSGGGLNCTLVNVQNPQDVFIDLEARARTSTDTTGQRVDKHSTLWKPGGPIVSVQLDLASDAWGGDSNLKVVGYLDPI